MSKKFNSQKKEKVLISSRLDSDLIIQIDSLCNKCNISRSEFIKQSLQYAIKNMADTE